MVNVAAVMSTTGVWTFIPKLYVCHHLSFLDPEVRIFRQDSEAGEDVC